MLAADEYDDVDNSDLIAGDTQVGELGDVMRHADGDEAVQSDHRHGPDASHIAHRCQWPHNAPHVRFYLLRQDRLINPLLPSVMFWGQ